jgi:voltage-dependent calcium channel
MENQKHISHQPTPLNSFTSTIDLPTPRTPSPSLVVEPDISSQRSSLTRRRSWGNNKLREAARAESSSVHPLHLDLDASMSPLRAIGAGGGGNDPFLSNHDRDRPIPQYTNDLYSNSPVDNSRASLMHGHFKHEMHEIEDDGHREDDEAHLTSNMSRTGTDTLLLEDDISNPSAKTPEYSIDDPEIEGGSTPRTRRRTVRYSVTPSPLKKTETAIKSVSRNLKKMSLRVVNLANTELEGHLRLGDGDADGGNKRLASEDEEDEGDPQPEKVFPIRGRALGFLGSESKIRLALFNFLVHPCVLLFYSPCI